MAELGNPHFIQAVYKLFALLDVDPHQIVVNYELPNSQSHVALAFPESKIGLALEGDNLEDFDKEWYITKYTVGELETFRRIYDSLNIAAFEHLRRESQSNMVKNGSKEEEMLLKAILSANLPKPNRNLRINRENGSELTTPDFAWENVKVAFFLDGLWWHVGKDDKERVRMINESASDPAKAELVMESNRHKVSKDADNRSELSSMGWTILSCTDEDIASEEGIKKQVERIAKTLRQKLKDLRAGTDTVSAVPKPEIII